MQPGRVGSICDAQFLLGGGIVGTSRENIVNKMINSIRKHERNLSLRSCVYQICTCPARRSVMRNSAGRHRLIVYSYYSSSPLASDQQPETVTSAAMAIEVPLIDRRRTEGLLMLSKEKRKSIWASYEDM